MDTATILEVFSRLPPEKLLEVHSKTMDNKAMREGIKALFRSYVIDNLGLESTDYIKTKVNPLGDGNSYWRFLFTIVYVWKMYGKIQLRSRDQRGSIFLELDDVSSIGASLTGILEDLGYTNKVRLTRDDLIVIAIYCMYKLGYSIRIDEYYNFVRSCISGCDNKVLLKCVCHSKEYCSKECANNDHSK